jgi:hypothetical protein
MWLSADATTILQEPIVELQKAAIISRAETDGGTGSQYVALRRDFHRQARRPS